VPVLSDRVHAHTRLYTLGESARGTPFSIERRYVAFAIAGVAREGFLVLNGALEEAFTRFA